jgi:hypothetical protein
LKMILALIADSDVAVSASHARVGRARCDSAGLIDEGSGGAGLEQDAGRGSDLAPEVIAKRVIALAKAGEYNPELLCKAVLKEFREQRL